MKRLILVFLGAATFAAAQPNLMPWPAKISFGQGTLRIDQSFRVAITGSPDARVQAAADRLIRRLALETGMPLAIGLARSFRGDTRDALRRRE
jgi:hypothetical protein